MKILLIWSLVSGLFGTYENKFLKIRIVAKQGKRRKMDLEWICLVPIGGTLCVLGLLGNTICTLVWYRIANSKESIRKCCAIYLIFLSASDSGVLSSFLFVETVTVGYPNVTNHYAFAAFFSWIAYPLHSYFIICSHWILIAVTLNRYLILKFPLKVGAFYTARKTCVGLAIFAMLAMPFNIPFWFYYIPEETKDGYQLTETEFANSAGAAANNLWVHCIVLVLFPFFTILIFNVLIMRLMSRRKERLHEIVNAVVIQEASKYERQITVSLLVVTFTFITLLFWQCVSKCFFVLRYGADLKQSSVWKFVSANFILSKIGLILCSSLNCVIYSIFGNMFRREFRRLFCFRQPTKTSHSTKEKKDGVLTTNA